MDSSAGKLRWRCRRGMKELDVLLRRYLDEAYPAAPLEQKLAFVNLLERQDPVIYAYFLGQDAPADPAEATLISCIIAGSSIGR
ncbi:MAG: succinate dehydrogenase assembly factor 2 [Steroidobacteraceae bacterium]